MINCNYSNNKISNDEWNSIQNRCIEHKHINPKENLKNIIETDEQILSNTGITFEQLEDFCFALRLYVKKYEIKENTKNIKPPIVKNFFEDQTDNFFSLNRKNWCLWNQSSYQFNMFDTNYYIIRYTWGGAERCPFQSPEDKNYHGYEYGSLDWLIWNLDTNDFMHIGDLLFHQISTHHFFQSNSSPYRVEPTKLIQLFNLKPNTNYKVNTIQVKYVRLSNAYSGSEIYEKIIKTLVSTENYVINLVVDSQEKEKYCLKLLNNSYQLPIIYNEIIFLEYSIGCEIILYEIKPRTRTELA